MDLPEGAKELIGATQTAARRGGLLLDKIARISGPIDMRPVPVVLRDFLDSFAPLARAPLPPDISFGYDCDISHAALLLDAGSLQDSLLNLVLNARDAIGASPGEIALTVREVQNTWLDIAVSDTGPGFGPDALEHALRIRSSRQRAKAARASACRWSTTWRSLPAGMCGSPTCRVAAPWSRCACP